MRSLLILSSLFFISSTQVNGMEIDLSADINIKTVYRNCTKYADRICDYTKKFVASENDEHKAYFYGKAKKNKKKLKKCEKDNKNEFKNKKPSINGGKIGFGFSF